MERDDYEADLTPWDQALARRVQPVFSSLFHDLMTPLAIVDSNLFLAERYIQMVIDKYDLEDEAAAQLQAAVQVVSIAKSAAKRIGEGLKIPRDAIWKAALEGTIFDVEGIKDAISAATKTAPKPKP